MNEHTKGPWIITQTNITGSCYVDARIGGGMLQEVAYCGATEQPGHSKGNAQLISAAPEMLEALEQLKALLMHPSNDADESMKELVDMCAAIDKARGRA